MPPEYKRCGIADTTPEAFDRLFEVNVKAPLFIMQEAAKHMVRAKSGVIINVASMLAHESRRTLPLILPEAALMTLSRSAANTFKRDGIPGVLHQSGLGHDRWRA